MFISLISEFTDCKIQIFSNETIIKHRSKHFFKQLIDSNVRIKFVYFINWTCFQDIVLGEFVMSPERTEIARFSRIIYINNLISLLSSEKKIDSVSYDILSIFNTEIWVLITLFLILISILGIRKYSRNTFLLEFLNSTIDHLECLIKNCC